MLPDNELFHNIVDNPSLKREPIRAEIDLNAKRSLNLSLNNRLHRQSATKHPEPQHVIHKIEVFGLITLERLELLYIGYRKVWQAIGKK